MVITRDSGVSSGRMHLSVRIEMGIGQIPTNDFSKNFTFSINATRELTKFSPIRMKQKFDGYFESQICALLVFTYIKCNRTKSG